MNNDLLLVLIGLGVLVVISVIFVFYTVKRSGDKKEAERFLEGLSGKLEDVILEIIRSFEPSDIEDISDAGIEKIETAILQKIYDVCWNYVKELVEKKNAENMDFFTRAVLSLLENRDFVEEFIKKLVDDASTKHTIYNRAKYVFLTVGERRIEELEEREEELTEEFSDKEKYVEESNEEDLPSGDSELLPTEEDLANLNPQRDEEEEELDPDNDISVEVVDEDNDIYYDKAGRARSKKTGKWTKDPKKQQK